SVLGTSGCGLIGIDWLILAQTDYINLVSGNVALRGQILNHSIGTTLAESVIVFRVAHRIGRALHGQDVTLGIRDIAGQLVERGLGVLGQVVFIKTKVFRGFGHDFIIVEVRDGILQRIYAV